MYTIASGRTILNNGIPVATIGRIGDSSRGYTTNPAELDDFAKHIVIALNHYLPDAMPTIGTNGNVSESTLTKLIDSY